MKKNKSLKNILLITSAVTVLAGKSAMASIITFTDRAAWEAAVTDMSTENFDAIAPQKLTDNSTTSVGLLDLETIVLPGAGGVTKVEDGSVDPFNSNVDGTNFLRMGLDGTPNRELNIGFNNTVVGWGTDWSLNNPPFTDLIEVNFAGESVIFGERGASGFIGFISDVAFTEVNVRNPYASVTFAGFDNISFATALAPSGSIPEPSSLAVLTLGFIGLTAKRFRKRIK